MNLLRSTCMATLLAPALGVLLLDPWYNNATSDVETVSNPSNLDGAKLNASATPGGSFDSWYFDVVSQSTNAGVNVAFYNTGDFQEQLGNEQPLAVQLSGKFANGTEFFIQTFAIKGATVANDQRGLLGNWMGSGAKFNGSSLTEPNATYTITFDGSPEGSPSVIGTISFNSIAPAHFPCDSKDVAGASENLLPGLFWSNAVPDAESVVDLTIDGAEYKITDGIGYHDKTWGQNSISTSSKYSDWGHARVGPYSIVFYDLLDYNNTERVYAYIAKDGEAELIGCGAGESVAKVRQWGSSNTTYPPTNKDGLLANLGLTVEYTAPSGDEYLFNITTTSIIKTESGVYSRAVGDVFGGIVGGETYEGGRAFYTEYTFGL
ncbi:hypothetical protein L218DRAFT_932596 [Marasmius fiardii PR-910]|nr:hypothetical protein L218DRAFT_932596 [Marasmius fiardii PR-910]